MNEAQQLHTELQRDIDVVAQLAAFHDHAGIAHRLLNLKEERMNDVYTILFLGEFNRGKSSLINCLLRTDVLPMDVTPTTAAINVIRFNDKPLIRIQSQDGHSEDLPFSSETLRKFTGDANTDSVRYVEIGMPNPLLRENTVIVDTPGVDDLDQQRVDITYNFIPQADAVVFVLSALSALNRSEVDFLQNAVLKNGITRIIVAVNYMDSLNDTVPEDLLRSLRNRIRTAMPSHSGQVYPVSARRALHGIHKGDSQGLDQINELERAMEALRETRGIDKAARLNCHLANIVEAFIDELETSLAVAQTTTQELTNQMELLQITLAKRDARAEHLRSWLNEREHEADLMITKSCDEFESRLQIELQDIVAGYSGQDFEKFLATQVPRLVKARLKDWAETHGRPLSSLLIRISNEIAASLSRSFNCTITPIRRGTDWSGITETSFSLPAIKVPNAMYRAGLIGGAAAGVVMLMGAPVVLPLIAMFGLPVLRDKLQEYNLANARPVASAHVHTAVHDVTENLRITVMTSFKRELSAIGGLAETKFNELLTDLHRELETETARRIQEHSRNITSCAAIQKSIAQLRTLCDQSLVPQPAVIGE